MSWLGDFIGGITGKSQQDATAKAAQKQNKTDLQYSADAKGALTDANSQLAALLPFIQGMGAKSQGDIEDMLKRITDYFGADDSKIGSEYDMAIGGAGAGNDASKAAIEQNFQDSLRTGSAAVAKSMAGTGLGTSTLVPSRIATSIVPNAIGSKMSALAALDNANADRVTGLRTAKAGAMTTRAGLRSSILTDTLGKKIDLANQYFGTELGTRMKPIENNLNVLAQPGAVYPKLNYPATVSGMSAAGSAFGPIGVGAAGSFANNYFGGIGKQAAGGAGAATIAQMLAGLL